MNNDEKRCTTYPLRLPVSLKDSATLLAHEDGVSLNHFISLAVAEKISRLEHSALSEHHKVSKHQKQAIAAAILNKAIYS
jgi:hypothetical protein